jgi:3-isopropylmalate/(R)-2-methylmalate dehydratase large subunit
MAMGRTIIEKILARHAGAAAADVAPGRIVWIDLDVRSARDFGGANVVEQLRRAYPDGPHLADPRKTFFTFDCVVPANTIPYANNQHTCRTFARGAGCRVFDVDSGIGSHVVIEQGVAVPGATVVGTDSHLNILGAVGCFGQGMGDTDIAFAFKTGRTWFEVPESVKVTLVGRPSARATAKDLALSLCGRLGSKGLLGRVAELCGECIDALPLAGRVTVCSMATEMGAIAAIIPPSREVLAFCGRRAGRPVTGVYADPDAAYAAEVTVDVSELEPQVARPGRPDDVVPVSAVGDVPIDSAFLGSCTNGRLADFVEVARVLEGRRVKPGVNCSAVPATREVYGELLRLGVIERLFRSGVNVSNPGCGGCAAGQIGMTGKGEVQVSTSNRNFTGKQGAGKTYLCSPATAAASAVAGRLCSVAEVGR